MSNISGIGNSILRPVGIAPTKPDVTTSVPAKAETPSNPPYIVDLTVTAIVKSMELQGLTSKQISASMGIDVKTVDSYLNVKPSEPALMTAPIKSSLKTPIITTDPAPESSTEQGTSGIPAVPAALAPPASFPSQANVNSAPSASKALGI